MPLIDKSHIAARRQLSKSVKDGSTQDKMINEYIEDAELEDIRPLLGEKFYNKIAANPGDYADILNEKEYTYLGNTYKHRGLKAVHADFAYARYVEFGSEVDTPFGRVEKEFQNGRNVDLAAKSRKAKAVRQSAITLWAQIQIFIERNKTTYPEYCEYDTKLHGTFLLTKVTT